MLLMAPLNATCTPALEAASKLRYRDLRAHFLDPNQCVLNRRLLS